MLYSDLFIKKEKKAPVVLLVPLLAIIIFIANIFFKETTLPSRALSNYPRQVKILPLPENRAIIFWETAEKEISYLLFGEKINKINQILLDDRDSQSFKTKRFFHIVTLNNLKPNQEYYFRIVSEKKIFNNLDGRPFRFKLKSGIGRVFTSAPLYGKAVAENSRVTPETILIFNTDQQPLSIITGKSSGDWLVVLRRLNKSFNEEEIITLEIFSEDKKKSVVKGKMKDFSPLTVPIIVGRNYDLTQNKENVLSTTIGGKTHDVFLIIYPKDKALIPGSKPLIKGRAYPGREVNVILKSKSIFSFKTKADKNGQWQVNINSNLLPGDYQLEAISADDKGKNLKKIVSFKIIKSGEQVLGEATPSATLVPSLILTPSPTLFLSPTIKPNSFSLISPTVYKTGRIDSFLYGLLGFIFLTAGIFFMLAS